MLLLSANASKALTQGRIQTPHLPPSKLMAPHRTGIHDIFLAKRANSSTNNQPIKASLRVAMLEFANGYERSFSRIFAGCDRH